MKKIAVISAILEGKNENHIKFNETVSEHRKIIRGRMGLPFDDIAVISITVIATLDEINSFTGKLGKIPNVTVKTAISQKNVD